ncbi:hypothetical protein HYZ97_05160 [Candidatus Pacearchaeota archaeon]|nr:hypothetical protein [Candidatus Pacearchaeota archaeon]
MSSSLASAVSLAEAFDSFQQSESACILVNPKNAAVSSLHGTFTLVTSGESDCTFIVDYLPLGSAAQAYVSTAEQKAYALVQYRHASGSDDEYVIISAKNVSALTYILSRVGGYASERVLFNTTLLAFSAEGSMVIPLPADSGEFQSSPSSAESNQTANQTGNQTTNQTIPSNNSNSSINVTLGAGADSSSASASSSGSSGSGGGGGGGGGSSGSGSGFISRIVSFFTTQNTTSVESELAASIDLQGTGESLTSEQQEVLQNPLVRVLVYLKQLFDKWFS